MEKLTNKEKQERLQKAKKVAHNVMHIVGYVSLGLLGLIVCLTASKCSKVKVQDNVQVQEVANDVVEVARPSDLLNNVRATSESSESSESSVTTTYRYNFNSTKSNYEIAETLTQGTNSYTLSGSVYASSPVVEQQVYAFDNVKSSVSSDSYNAYLEFYSGETKLLRVGISGGSWGQIFSNPSLPQGTAKYVIYDEAPTGSLLEVQEAISDYVQPPVVVPIGEAWTDAITGFATALATGVNSIVAIFYADNSLTFLGILLCIAMGVGVVYFAFRLIRGLIRNRG